MVGVQYRKDWKALRIMGRKWGDLRAGGPSGGRQGEEHNPHHHFTTLDPLQLLRRLLSHIEKTRVMGIDGAQLGLHSPDILPSCLPPVTQEDSGIYLSFQAPCPNRAALPSGVTGTLVSGGFTGPHGREQNTGRN